jgi:hypothetical protein
MIEFRQATYEDGLAIIANLREQERATTGKLQIDVPAVLAEVLATGDPAFTAAVDDVPACMVGITFTSVLTGQRLWMLTTPLIESHQVAFLRYSKLFVQFARTNFGPIDIVVDSENQISVRWLHWLGFRIVTDGEYKHMRLV